MSSSSNLNRFLNHTTPSVQCQNPLKSFCADDACHGWKCRNERMMLPFNFGDLWSSLDEWSAYGAGVPLVLPCGETIMQYYVPYLSALQIYMQPAYSWLSNKRRPGDESDWSDASDARDSTTSDFGSDNESEKTSLSSRQMKSNQCDSASCASSERPSSASSSEQGDRNGELIFEYFERASPYSRAPLAGKIIELARIFPQLCTLSSSDVSSASWFSVAWYPIYRIPVGHTMSDLSTCFLTFHSLWTPPCLQGGFSSADLSRERALKGDDAVSEACVRKAGQSIEQDQEQWLRGHAAWRQKPRAAAAALELPAFGLACYKLRGPFWDTAGPTDKRQLSSLAASADAWLRQVRAQHPDFDFFSSREGMGVYK